MRIDPDLVRKILLRVEGEEAVDLSSYTAEQIRYHEYQLVGADLLDGEVHFVADDDLPLVLIRDLTWAGHQFLANARNDTIWNRAKTEIVKLGGSLGIEAIKLLLSRISTEIAK